MVVELQEQVYLCKVQESSLFEYGRILLEIQRGTRCIYTLASQVGQKTERSGTLQFSSRHTLWYKTI